MGHFFALILDLLLTGLFKNFFGQLRPDYLDRVREDEGVRSGRQSMPSGRKRAGLVLLLQRLTNIGHASAASCVTFFLALYLHVSTRPWPSASTALLTLSRGSFGPTALRTAMAL